jgi:hypothetical protein
MTYRLVIGPECLGGIVQAKVGWSGIAVEGKPSPAAVKLAGSDWIVGSDGRPVDCWLVTADYNTGTVQSRWWVDKASQLVLCEESKRDDGSMFIKIPLPPEAGDGIVGRTMRPAGCGEASSRIGPGSALCVREE